MGTGDGSRRPGGRFASVTEDKGGSWSTRSPMSRGFEGRVGHDRRDPVENTPDRAPRLRTESRHLPSDQMNGGTVADDWHRVQHWPGRGRLLRARGRIPVAERDGYAETRGVPSPREPSAGNGFSNGGVTPGRRASGGQARGRDTAPRRWGEAPPEPREQGSANQTAILLCTVATAMLGARRRRGTEHHHPRRLLHAEGISPVGPPAGGPRQGPTAAAFREAESSAYWSELQEVRPDWSRSMSVGCGSKGSPCFLSR